MSWFSGTATGRVYQVGASYSMGGDRYTAQKDGTFKNERTGRALVGSSKDPRTTFGGSSSLAGGGAARGQAGSGPGAANSNSGQATPSAGVGPGNAVVGNQALERRVNAAGGGPSRVTEVWLAGGQLPLDRGSSDAADWEDRYGEGDFLSPSWFGAWAVAGRDAYVGTFNTQKLEADAAKLPEAAASGALDFAGWLTAQGKAKRQERAFKTRDRADGQGVQRLVEQNQFQRDWMAVGGAL